MNFIFSESVLKFQTALEKISVSDSYPIDAVFSEDGDFFGAVFIRVYITLIYVYELHIILKLRNSEIWKKT